MFTKRFKLFRLIGIPIYIDLSWFLIAALITWSLATNLFPQIYPDLSVASYWWMGAAGALGLFVSILAHELGHSAVAQRFNVPMRSITLFLFGGVAEMSEEPPSAKAEFMVAIAGPIVSVLIAIFCFAFTWLDGVFPTPVIGTLAYLAGINMVVVIFNLIPAFPLDGGRVLRAILWHFRGDLRSATRVTTSIGSGFGLFLIMIGVFSFISGNIVGGLWQFLIGMFLRNAAQLSYQQVLIRRALDGEVVGRFMHKEVVTVPPTATIGELVENYVYQHHHKMFPVTENGRLLGCITTRNIKDVPRDEWNTKRVAEIVEPCSKENTVSEETDAMQALAKMSRHQLSRLIVVRDGALRGILSLKDLLRFISLKVELEEETGASSSMRHLADG